MPCAVVVGRVDVPVERVVGGHSGKGQDLKKSLDQDNLLKQNIPGSRWSSC